jgi:hypothetical protein
MKLEKNALGECGLVPSNSWSENIGESTEVESRYMGKKFEF